MDRCAEDHLHRQRVELVGSRRIGAASVLHLDFHDHMHELDAAQQKPRAAKNLEAEHGSGATFDGPMVLPDEAHLLEGGRLGASREYPLTRPADYETRFAAGDDIA